MSEKANYFKIGLFFVVSVTLLTVAVVIWGAGLFTKDKIYFETYFDSPVTGLAIGSSCELMGVKLGQVEEIDFASSVYDISTGPETVSRYERYIRVLFSISAEESKERTGGLTNEQREARTRNMIQQGLRLRLASNFLTGQSYIEGVFVDPNRFPILPITWEPKHLYVASAPGEFSTIKESVDKILTRLEQIDTQRIGDLVEQLLVSVNEAIDDADVPGISKGIQSFVANANEAIADADVPGISSGVKSLVTNADQAIDDVNLPSISNEIISLLAEARQTNQHLQKLLKSPEKTESEMANIAVMVAQLNKTLIRIDKLVLTQTPQIEQALEDLRGVSSNLKELTDSIKQYPSQLIFSQPPSKSEVSK